MPSETLLLIEDDPELRFALRLALEDEDYTVIEAADATSGLARFDEAAPDLVLLDLRLPDRRGLDVCRELRSRSTVPIIIVTAQTDTHDLVAGLESGADDYVTKPVVPKALAARIRAVLRRAQPGGISVVPTAASDPDDGHTDPGGADVIRLGDLEIREREAVVTRAGSEIELTRTEFKLLLEFARHPNLVLTRDQLLQNVWGYDYLGDSRLVDAHLHRLRAKVETPGAISLIQTVRGLGYKLVPPRPST